MNPWITRADVWCAAGRGLERLADAARAGVPLRRDVPYAMSGLRSPFAGMLTARASAEDMLDEVVRAVLPAEGSCGLVVATSSGAISGEFEAWHCENGGGASLPFSPHTVETAVDRMFAAVDSEWRAADFAWRQGPARTVAARHALTPVTTVSVACASGTAAFAIARGWLRDGVCERVVVAGVDALSLYIHAGFAGLGALAKERSRVFSPERDGLMLGEGAAAFLLERPGSSRPPLTTLRGIGLSQDGVHLTAPDRSGNGLYRAALTDAGVDPEEIGTVSAHGTGTPFNDAMEARALARLFGRPVPLHAAKPIVGHTLGAAGAIEAALVLAILGGAEPPPPLSPGDCEVEFSSCHQPKFGLSVSAAFGGVNAALLFGPDQPSAFAPIPVVERSRSEVAADSFDLPSIGAPPNLGRADTYVRAGIAALHPLSLPADAAVVVTSESNCRQADLRYHADLLARGPGAVSRMHFTYTVPGSPLAEAAILKGLRGPALVFCDAAARGEAEAQRLVTQGLAPTAVALHIEAPERSARASAVLYARAR